MASLFKNTSLVGNTMRSLKAGSDTESEKSCVVFIERGKTASLVILNYYFFIYSSGPHDLTLYGCVWLLKVGMLWTTLMRTSSWSGQVELGLWRPES